MADSTQHETPRTEMPRPVARTLQWTVGQVAGLVFSSIFAGTGGLYLMAQAGFLSTGTQLTEITGELAHVKTELAYVKTQVDKVEGGQSGLTIAIEEVQGASNDEHAKTRKSMTDWIEEQRNSLASLEESIAGQLDDNRRNIATHSSNTANSMKEISDKQQQMEMTLSNHIKALSSRIESVQSAFVEKLEELIEEGKKLIKKEDFEKIEKWITKANYMVRSLEIPAEDGLLKDTSVVKEDLRDAMSRFDKAQDDNAKLAQAQRVLVIIEAVSELAVGGRIP